MEMNVGFEPKTVGELREIIKNLPDSTKIGEWTMVGFGDELFKGLVIRLVENNISNKCLEVVSRNICRYRKGYIYGVRDKVLDL
jgi:hypothetical protein